MFLEDKAGQVGLVQLVSKGLQVGPEFVDLCVVSKPIIYSAKAIRTQFWWLKNSVKLMPVNCPLAAHDMMDENQIATLINSYLTLTISLRLSVTVTVTLTPTVIRGQSYD